MSLYFEEADQTVCQRHTRNLGRRAREAASIQADARSGLEPRGRATLGYIQPFRGNRSPFDRSKKAKLLGQRRRVMRRYKTERFDGAIV